VTHFLKAKNFNKIWIWKTACGLEYDHLEKTDFVSLSKELVDCEVCARRMNQ
jgi:hypothetical protein